MELSPGVAYFLHQLDKLLLSSGSNFSLTSLACAFLVAAAVVVARRVKRNRRIRLATLGRVLFPRRIFKSPSSAIDLGYLFFNVFVYGVILGWAVLSFQFLSNTIIEGLVAVFGATQSRLPGWGARTVITLVLFLAYELGYWLHHYLSHRVPFLWEFHKVHHTAEVLTPLTVFRVHPGDTLLFANILAVVTAVANGAASYALGETAYQYAISGSNIILVFFIHIYVHLQHTHLWISFRGLLGRILLSPAHHQVHHSTNPAHFNKNLGSCLAVWDWLFGTLHIPSKEPEKLTFGVEDENSHPHTITEGLFAPFIRAAGHLVPPQPATAAAPLVAAQEQKQA